MTIAITGASGHLGRLVVEKLKQKVDASTIVALARSPEKIADLGVQTRAADYGKPETLDAALAGIDTLLLISSSEVGQRATQHGNIIAAAKKAGVKRIVYTSLLRAASSPLSLAPEHKQTEDALAASGIPHTILRNGWYTENYTGSIGGAIAGGAFIGSAGDGNVSSAPRADYADAAVAVLTSDGHDGQVYELAGDAPYTLADLAAEISTQTGKDIPYKNLPEADYASTLAGFGLPAELAASIAGWDAAVAHGALYEDGKQLSKLIGRPTGSLADAVKAALA